MTEENNVELQKLMKQTEGWDEDKLRESFANVALELMAIRSSMALTQTAYKLFLSPLVDIITNRKAMLGANATFDVLGLQQTIGLIVDQDLENQLFNEEEKEFIKYVKGFLCEAKKEEESLIQTI